MIVIAVAALIIVLVLVAAPALQRNARNTQRRNDIGAIKGQLTTVFNNNNNTYPSHAILETDVLAQVEQAVYQSDVVTNSSCSTATALTEADCLALTPPGTWTAGAINAFPTISSENEIYYTNDRFGDTTEATLDSTLTAITYPGPDELHIIVGAQCANPQMVGGNTTVEKSAMFDNADLTLATLKVVSLIYQLEGETTARCEDTA